MRTLFLCLATICLLASCTEKDMYLFSYFKGNGEDGLHFAYSEDGYHWKDLSEHSFLKPELSDKLMRDPCIILGGDGRYHMVWTVSWAEKGIGYASSEDLLNWSEQKYIPVMAHEDGVRNCWAPEITFDSSSGEYMIYWSSTVTGRFSDRSQESENGYNHRIYYITTKDFRTFSQTRMLYDHGFNVIDASIVPENGRYVMFLKDETLVPPQKNIRVAYAEHLSGPYSEPSAPITGNYWAEGPTALRMGKYWIVYFDKYRDGKFGAVRSADLQSWEDISDQISMPNGIRHGSILKVPAHVVRNMMNPEQSSGKRLVP